jgi:hypothetical protein
MCFSAEASFVAGVALTATAVITIRKVKSRDKLLFAAIPLIFGIQQLTEGFVWLSLSGNKSWSLIPITIFLFFAHVVWPVWVPLSVLATEKDPKRRRILMGMLIIGISVSIYLGLCLVFRPVNALIRDHHIFYDLKFPPGIKWISAFFYFIPTVVPPFISSYKKMVWLGLAVLTSYIISQIFFEGYVISVWCFFAAVISGAVYFIVHSLAEEHKLKAKLTHNAFSSE